MKSTIYALLLLLPACGSAFADQDENWFNGGTVPPDNFSYEEPPPDAVLNDLAAPVREPDPDPYEVPPDPVESGWDAYRACVARLVDALWRTRGEPRDIVRNAQARCARQRAAYVAAVVASARSRGEADPARAGASHVAADDERLDFELGTEIEQRRYPDGGT